MANSVDPDQTAPIGAVCSGPTLFASILNSSVMLGNYLQQTTSADDIFRHFKIPTYFSAPSTGEGWPMTFQDRISLQDNISHRIIRRSMLI